MLYKRIRTKSSPNGYTTCEQAYTPPGGQPQYSVMGTYTTSSQRETMADNPVPGYRKLIASGAIVNQPADYVSQRLEEIDGRYDAVYTGSGAHYERWGAVCSQQSGGFDPLGYAPDVDVDPLIADAKQQCVADINSTPYAFAEDTLEVANTLRFLRNPAQSLYKLAKDTEKTVWKYRRKRIKAAQMANVLNDLYLTRQFAIRPLVQSSYNAIDALNDKRNFTAERYNARGFASDSDSWSGEHRRYYSGTVWDSFQIVAETTVKVHAYSMYSFRSERDALFKAGLRGSDGLVGLWQVVPLSFMVDRMLDISSFIKGFDVLTDPRLYVLASGFVVRKSTKASMSYTGQTNPGWVTSGSGTITKHNYNYTRYTSWTPRVSDTLPRFKPSNLVRDTQSIADLFSLSAKIFTRSFKLSYT